MSILTLIQSDITKLKVDAIATRPIIACLEAEKWTAPRCRRFGIIRRMQKIKRLQDRRGKNKGAG